MSRFVLILLMGMIGLGAFAEDLKNVELVRVYDGDTFFINIDGVPDVFGKEIGVRVRGVDTPEIRGKCPEEKELAYKARDFVKELLDNATSIDLIDVDRDKYFRVLASVVVDGVALETLLIDANLGVPYDGGKKSKLWCN